MAWPCQNSLGRRLKFRSDLISLPIPQSRGFAFLTFESVDDATAARNSLTDTGILV